MSAVHDAIRKRFAAPAYATYFEVGNATGTKCNRKVEAPKVESRALDRHFVAALLRVGNEQCPNEAALRAAEAKGLKEGIEQGIRIGKAEAGFAAKNAESLQKQVDAFEAASGIRINAYTDSKNLGELVKLIGRMTSGDGSASKLNAMNVEANSIKKHAELVIESVAALQKTLHGKAA